VIQDRPPVDDLLRTVREFVESIRPQLSGEAAFHARVAVHLLQICERELAQTGAASFEAARLAAALGREAPLAEQCQALCAAIRAGDFDDRWDEAFDLVLRQVVDKLRIVRPEWLAVPPSGGGPGT
jgi:hypothetical protein